VSPGYAVHSQNLISKVRGIGHLIDGKVLDQVTQVFTDMLIIIIRQVNLVIFSILTKLIFAFE